MRRNHVVVKGGQTFEVYGDERRGYCLSIWEYEDGEAERIDVDLNDLIEALGELEVGTLSLNRDEIRT